MGVFPVSPCATSPHFAESMAPRSIESASMRDFHVVYQCVVDALALPSWAEAELRVDLGLAALSSEPACQCKNAVKQLYLLFGTHHLLPPATAFAKLDDTLETMPREVPLQLRAAIRVHFENVLIYGVIHRVSALEFVLDASTVPSLLDEYRWPRNKKRDHMKHLLTKIVRGLAELRGALTYSPSHDESSLSTAGEHFRKTVQRAVDKHGTYLPAQVVARLRVAAFMSGRKLHHAALNRCKMEKMLASLPTKQLSPSHLLLIASLATTRGHGDTRGGHSCPPESDSKELQSAVDRHWTVDDGESFARHVRTGRPTDRQGFRLVAACKKLCSSRRSSREEAPREQRSSRVLGHKSAAGHLRSLWLLDGVYRRRAVHEEVVLNVNLA